MAAQGSAPAAGNVPAPEWKPVFRRDLFKGHVSIVTGGGTGIGKAIAEELVACGGTVVIAARNEDRLQEAAADLNSKGYSGRAHAVACNIRDLEQVQALFQSTIRQHGRCDALVNNGGGQFLCPAEALSDRGWAAVVDLNLNGTFRMCREAFAAWMADHGGCIVNITLEGGNGFPMMAHSAAARAGVTNLTKTLAWEWAPSGVRVNAVEPGIVYNPTAFANYGAATDDLVPVLLKSLPSRRLGTVQETASAVVWLLSPGAAYVSGVTINVSGGGQLTHKPLMTLPDKSNMPVYGDLPAFAKL